MKHYMDITRLKEKYAVAFTNGEDITVTEKVDGANASITYDKDTKGNKAFSRKNELNESNTLQGFWNYVQTIDPSIVDTVTLGGRYVIFGEWLVKHTIKYPDSCYKKFYMFDVWDTVTEAYLPHEIVYGIYETMKMLGADLEFVPIIFKGKFTTWDDLMKFVGTTSLGAEPCGEGIVVKSQDRLNDADSSKSPKYIKIVSEKFSEVHQDHQKPVDPEVLKAKAEAEAFVASIATERRIQKCLEKLVDEGILPADWDEHNMKDIAKVLPRMVYDDCRKEEPDEVLKVDDFGKACAKLSMAYARKALQNR